MTDRELAARVYAWVVDRSGKYTDRERVEFIIEIVADEMRRRMEGKA